MTRGRGRLTPILLFVGGACVGGDTESDVGVIDGERIELGPGVAYVVNSYQVSLYDRDAVTGCGLPPPPSYLTFHIPSMVGEYPLDPGADRAAVVSNALFVSPNQGMLSATAGKVSVEAITPTSVRGHVDLWIVGDDGNRVRSDFNATICASAPVPVDVGDAGTAEGAGDAGDAATPRCDVATAECPCSADTQTDDCAEPKPWCVDEVCVACREDVDCTTPAAPLCVDGACSACRTSADCARFAEAPICSDGTCVECTASEASLCGNGTCDALRNVCTPTAPGSVGICQPCVADEQCEGFTLDPVGARCVPMTFQQMSRASGYCLRPFAVDCNAPWATETPARGSLSGAAPEPYCGINEALTTCEAIADARSLAPCSNDDSTQCGCPRDPNGSCTSPGEGGVCRFCDINECACDYPCDSDSECPDEAGVCSAGWCTPFG
ncbi:MAG TPA: hypothetical protein VMG12_01890 [Polyangiaceae bacterium]|nr:hypothetical protein [Polyangiaceae bacterium]